MTSQKEERSLDTLAESPTERLTLRMTKEEREYIEGVAKAIGCSVNRAIRHILWTCNRVERAD